MQLTVYRDSTGFRALRDEWNPLLAASRFNTPFLTWEWQSTWWSHLGEGDLFLLAWREDSDRLAGLAPLYLQTAATGESKLTLVGCIEVSDYLDVIAADGRETQVLAALMDWLSGSEAPHWDVVDMCNLPEVSLTHQRLPEMARSQGYGAVVTKEDVCPVIDLPDSWDAYLKMLGKKQRHEVRRKIRRAEEAGEVSWYIVEDYHDLAAEMDDFIELHRLSRRDKDQFMEPQMQRFFHAAARTMLDSGWLQLSFLQVNGQKAATMLCFDYADSILVYNSGYAPQVYSAISPGIVLLARVIQHAIEGLGRGQFDFLQGDEVYKYRFGAHETHVLRTLITKQELEPTSPRAAEMAAG
jgi:CelD/BcsL family acetyltransferase involved in cellulose biosynthesis